MSFLKEHVLHMNLRAEPNETWSPTRRTSEISHSVDVSVDLYLSSAIPGGGLINGSAELFTSSNSNTKATPH